MNATVIDWAALYEKPFVTSDNCWQHCGGYCCGNFSKMKFSSEVVVPFFPHEYEYYCKNPIQMLNVRTSQRQFSISNNITFTVHFLHCKCNGMCEPSNAKPLLCRLYPLLPVPNVMGDILYYESCALTDVCFASKAIHPCYILQHDTSIFKDNIQKSLSKLLCLPEMNFSFQLLALVVQNLRSSLTCYIDDYHDASQVLLARNEFVWKVLRGEPWRNANFLSQVNDSYAQMCSVWGTSWLSSSIHDDSNGLRTK